MNAKKPDLMDRNKAAIIESLETGGCSRLAAYSAAHTPKGTFYLWLEKDPEFKQNVELAEASAIRNASHKLYERGMNDDHKGCVPSLIFWLKNMAGWRDVQDHHVTGSLDVRTLTLNELLKNGESGSEPTAQ